MKKIVDIKTGRKTVVFNKYSLNGEGCCPECKRMLKDRDYKALEDRKTISCPKCGARLEK